jgi:hypothetical protein
MPHCKTQLVADSILAEICHVQARRKGGARYNSSLTEEAKNAAANLLLLCPTCHTMADKDKTGKYTVQYLQAIKAQHESGDVVELSQPDALRAINILAKHVEKKISGQREVYSGSARATATKGGVAVSINGNSNAPINIRTSLGSGGRRGYANNSIGADANLSGYVDYLVDLYVRYMGKLESNEGALRGRIGRHIKSKFRLRKRTRNDLPAERFRELVEYLVSKLEATPVGQKHCRNGTKICTSFDDWRTTTR